jgi:hypothetical protein
VVPFSPNGFGEIPKNLELLVRLYQTPFERDRIGCNLFVIIHDSLKTRETQKEVRAILRGAPSFPAVYGLAVQETEAWVLGDIDNVNRHVFRLTPKPALPRSPEKDPDPKSTLTELFVKPSLAIEFDRWNTECARRVAPHLRRTQIATQCPKGFARFIRELRDSRPLLKR